jgi:hypothetical protein
VILLVLALVLLAVVLGGRRLGAGLRGVLRVWRPTAGLAAVATLVGAAALALREDWLPAAGFFVLSAVLAVGARKRRAERQAQSQAQFQSPPKPARMSADEARAILGLEPGDGPEAIQAAYRRLMLRTHPDQGGTRGLAAQLNLARDVLLGR